MAFCPYCGSEYDSDLKSCPICGKKFSAGLQKKVKSAQTGQWVQARVIPWKKVSKITAIAAAAAVLATSAVLCLFNEDMIQVGTPTVPTVTVPRPTDPLPTDPDPTVTDPTEPLPTDPTFTDPQPTDPQPTDPLPTDPNPTEPQPTDPQPTDPVEVTIVGTWFGQVNMAKFFNEKLVEEYPTFGDYLCVNTMKVQVVLIFTDGGNVTCYVDQDSYCSAVSKNRSVWDKGIRQYIKDDGVKPEEYEELTGVTIESMVSDIIKTLHEKNVEGASKTTLGYTYSNDRLVLSGGKGEFNVSLTAKSLQFSGYEGEYEDLSIESIISNAVFYKG